VKGEVPDEEYLIPSGQADVRPRARTSPGHLGQAGLHLPGRRQDSSSKHKASPRELLDLRTIRPLDHEALFRSRQPRPAGPWWCTRATPSLASAPRSSPASKRPCFDVLDAPVLRVTNRDVPQPYATNLEKLVMPDAPRVIEAIRKTLAR
jgi:pyruvate dehydrogenase E1 component beta subunit